MIKCSVCLVENDDFSVTCRNCRAFIQNRIPNLNLFETAWGILESPRATFHKITLAEHKNYSILLFSLFGISLSFTAFWYFKIGNQFDTLLDLIFWALLWGILAGAVVGVLLTSTYHLAVRAVGGRRGVRTSYALLAYSVTPIVLSLFFVLPIELLTFGMYLFTSNPHPYTIKPFSYVLLVSFDVLISAWSMLLAIIGTAVGKRLSYLKSTFIVMCTLGVMAGIFLLATSRLQL